MSDQAEVLDYDLKTSDAAKRLGVSPKTLHNWREKGIAPPHVVIGPGVIRWSEQGIEERRRKGMTRG